MAAKQSKSKKIKVSSLNKRNPLIVVGTIMLILSVLATGTYYFFAQRNKSEYQAQAGAYQLNRKQDYRLRIWDTNLAVCQRSDGVKRYVRALASVPKSAVHPNDKLYIHSYRSSSKSTDYHYSYSQQRWAWGNDQLMLAEHEMRPGYDWFYLRYNYGKSSIYGTITESKMISINYVPGC